MIGMQNSILDFNVDLAGPKIYLSWIRFTIRKVGLIAWYGWTSQNMYKLFQRY